MQQTTDPALRRRSYASTTTAEIVPVRWIGKNYAWAGRELWQSLAYYATHRLRNLVLGELQQAAPDAFLYGGIVRKTLRAVQCRQDYLQNCKSADDLYDARFPQDCFVAPDTDLDLYFSCEEDIDKFVRHMKEKSFQVRDMFLQDAGEGDGGPSHDMVLRRIKVQTPFHLFGPRSSVMMDLSAHSGSSPPRLHPPDFSVNTLQQSVAGDFHVSVRSWNMAGVCWAAASWNKISLEDGALAAKHLQEVLCQINAGETTMYLATWDRYQELDIELQGCPAPAKFPRAEEKKEKGKDMKARRAKLREEYLKYVSTVLGPRLRKMLRQGWKVTNLLLDTNPKGQVLLECGELSSKKKKDETGGVASPETSEEDVPHVWEAGGQWRIVFGRVEFKCPTCQKANVAFHDWI